MEQARLPRQTVSSVWAWKRYPFSGTIPGIVPYESSTTWGLWTCGRDGCEGYNLHKNGTSWCRHLSGKGFKELNARLLSKHTNGSREYVGQRLHSHHCRKQLINSSGLEPNDRQSQDRGNVPENEVRRARA